MRYAFGNVCLYGPNDRGTNISITFPKGYAIFNHSCSVVGIKAIPKALMLKALRDLQNGKNCTYIFRTYHKEFVKYARPKTKHIVAEEPWPLKASDIRPYLMR